MIKSDQHMHSSFSGDSQAKIEDIIDSAVSKGLDIICLTDHYDPLFPCYQEGEDAIFDLDTKSYNEANSIYHEFLKRGFASDKVKNAVSWIRKMLFDDSQDIYREILCAEIRLSESDDMRLEFIFEHAPSCRCFSIGIPVKRPKLKEIAGKWRIGYEDENYPRRYGGDALCTNIAGFDLVQPYNNGSTETVAYHYDMRVFKKQFDDYVHNGFKTMAESKNGQWRWIGYDSFDYSAMGEPPMSAHDYLNESI